MYGPPRPARLAATASIIGVAATAALSLAPSQAAQVAGPPRQPLAVGYLNAIGGGPRSAWAAGWYRRSASVNLPLFDRLSGSSWHAVPGKLVGRDDSIDGVAARTAADAWAVGVYLPPGAGAIHYRTLTERWNGARWVHIPSPDPGRVFRKGKNASFLPDNELDAVADIGPRDAWAAGYWSQPVLPEWENTNAILLHFNGTSWHVVIAPDPLGLPHDYALDAIVARSAHDIWAAGGYPTSPATGKLLIEHYDGRRWTIVRAPSPGLDAVVSSLSLGSGGTIWAAGSYTVPARKGTGVDSETLILRWNGSAWKRVPSPDPSAYFNVLTGISGSAGGRAWAVGGYNPDPSKGPSEPDRTLTLEWTGARWRAVASPDPADQGNYLYGVLSIGSRAFAVGEADSGRLPSLIVRPLMIGWNGSRWRPVGVPAPGS